MKTLPGGLVPGTKAQLSLHGFIATLLGINKRFSINKEKKP